MAAGLFLTDAERARLQAFPTDVSRDDVAAHFTLSRRGLREVRCHRGDAGYRSLGAWRSFFHDYYGTPFSGGGGCGGGSGLHVPPTPGTSDDAGSAFFDGDEGELQTVTIGDGIVRFRDSLVTDDYEATVLNASTQQALSAWLDDNGFGHDADDDRAFAHYVGEGAWFVALRVHPPDDGGSRLGLEPVVVSWRGSHIPLLHQLQHHPAGGRQFTETFVMAPDRMRARDGSAETLYAAPALFGGEVAGFGLPAGWITQLSFERDVARDMPDSELIATVGEVRPVIEVMQTVRIPSSECPPADDGCNCAIHGGHGSGGLGLLNRFGPLALALVVLWRRTKR